MRQAEQPYHGMKPQVLKKILQGYKTFENMTDAQLDLFLLHSNAVVFEPGEYIFKEGDVSVHSYVILEGHAEVLGGNDELLLAEKHAGDCVGEVAMIDKEARSAHVLAKTMVKAIEFDIASFDTVPPSEIPLAAKLKINMGKSLTASLRGGNLKIIDNLKKRLRAEHERNVLAYLTFNVTLLTSFYMVVENMVGYFRHHLAVTTIVSPIILFVFAAGYYSVIKRSTYSLHDYGLTFRGGLHDIKDAVFYTIIILIPAVLLLKFIAIHYFPSYATVPLFFYSGPLERFDFIEKMMILFVYMMMVPFQEFIVRCGAQRSFQFYLPGRHAVAGAIVLSSIFFSLSHVHVSFTLAIAAFPFTLFWGWLFSRHESVMGVIVSHLMVGVFAFYVVGFNLAD